MGEQDEKPYDPSHPSIQDTAGDPQTTDELRAAKEYAEMIVDTVRESLLVLDLDLRVQAANESFYAHFQVAPEDTKGALIYELGNGQWDIPSLRHLLEEVLPEDKVFDDYEVERDFEEIGHRVMLLNARQLDHHQLILLAIEDVTERKQAMRELEEMNEQLEERVEKRTREVSEREERVRHLASALTEAEERERRRIAAILHDDLQQQIYSAEMTARRARRLLESDLDEETIAEMAEMCDQMDDILDEAMETTRTLSSELSPTVLRDEDLTNVLRWVARHMEERHGLVVELDVEDALTVENRKLRALLLRFTRELLFNVAKHADAGRAALEARTDEEGLIVQVRDEGKGFGAEQLKKQGSGFGLSHMRERLRFLEGRLELETAPGQGTRVTIALPGSVMESE